MYVARSSIVKVTAAVAVLGGLSACGRVDPASKPDGERPPATLQLSAAITNRGVSLSPTEIGGGPLRVVVSNQTDQTVRAVLRRNGGGTARVRTRDPIEPGGVATLTADVTRGTWRLSAGGKLAPATLAVGAERDTSDGDLLLP
jgi:hypothetical protein